MYVPDIKPLHCTAAGNTFLVLMATNEGHVHQHWSGAIKITAGECYYVLLNYLDITLTQ